MAGNDRACCPKGHLDSALAFGGNSLLQGKAKQGKKEKARPENLGWRGDWVVVGGCSGISEQRAESRGREWLAASMSLMGLLLQSHIGLGF